MSESAVENGKIEVEEQVVYGLPHPLALALLNYLAKQPYGEVHVLISAMQALKDVSDT